MHKRSLISYGGLALTGLLQLAGYALIAYGMPRTEFASLMITWVGLFFLYWMLVVKFTHPAYFKLLLFLSVAVRLTWITALPALSDDYFRFLWDGAITQAGQNPYLHLPAGVTNIAGVPPAFISELKAGMNSLPYYSPYPPVLQALFFLSIKIGGYQVETGVMVMRFCMLLAEVGSCYFAIALLDYFKLPRQRLFWYALNPLVVIELTGNLHGEAWMIFFMLAAAWCVTRKLHFVAAVLLGLAIATKFLPLIFFPAVIGYAGIKRGLIFCAVAIATAVTSFIPFMDSRFIFHISQSLGYYFQHFEFNASIYYLFRWVGYDVTGFNLIIVFGKLMPLLAFIGICSLAWYKKITTPQRLVDLLLISLLWYYLCSLVVHPWYITVLVAISMFTRFRFAMAWSGLVLLSYAAYQQWPYKENGWLTGLEYIILGIVLFYEYNRYKLSTRVK